MFPDKLKLSKVVPIYKKGPRSQPSSYRPISLIPVLAKVLEYVIFNQLYEYLELNGFLNINQFGFRRKKSTIDAIEILLHEVLRNLKINLQLIFPSVI